MKAKKFVASLLCISFILSTKLFAVMGVGPLLVNFIPENDSYMPQTFTVRNTDDKSIYVNIEISKLVDTQDPEKKQVFDGKTLRILV